MANRYSVGDKVMVSRDESGENHEPASVIDAYELIIGDDRKPMVVVEFEDRERKYITATTPNVLPVEEEEDEPLAEPEAEGEDADEDEWDEPEEGEGDDDEDEGDVLWVEDEEGASP